MGAEIDTQSRFAPCGVGIRHDLVRVPEPRIDAESDINQVAELLRKLLREGQAEEAIGLVVALLSAVRSKNSELELRVRKLLKQQYGRKHEGISSAQLSLFLSQLEGEAKKTTEELESLSIDEDEEDGESKQGLDAEGNEEAPKKCGGRKGGRRVLPENIQRVRHVHLVPEDERACEICAREKSRIGFEVRSRLDFEPARFVAHEDHIEKLACKPCGEGVVVAEAPGKPIEGGIPGPGLLSEVLVNKYRDALPLYRQVQRFARLGIEIPRSTMVDWVRQAAAMLEPLAELIEERALAAYVLHADATGLAVLDKSHPANIKRGSLLAHVADTGEVFFKYAPNQQKETPQKVLAKREGYLVVDAAGVYEGLFRCPHCGAIECGCWMHSRRYFIKAFELGDLRAGIAVRAIKKLYKIEARAQRKKLEPDAVKALRQAKSKPIPQIPR